MTQTAFRTMNDIGDVDWGTARIMAGSAIACGNGRRGSGVIHHTRRKSAKAVHVASVALGRSRNMRRRLAERIDADIRAAMASGALSVQPGMAHPCRPECRVIGMAGIALRNGRNMRGIFAQCGCAIMASRALAGCRCIMCIGSASPGRC